jgi:hypothetical protein
LGKAEKLGHLWMMEFLPTGYKNTSPLYHQQQSKQAPGLLVEGNVRWVVIDLKSKYDCTRISTRILFFKLVGDQNYAYSFVTTIKQI